MIDLAPRDTTLVKHEQNQLSKKAGTILEDLGGAVGVQNEYMYIYIYTYGGFHKWGILKMLGL